MLSKEELNGLPLVAYAGDVKLICSMEDMDAALDKLYQSKVLGCDTESRPVFVKGEGIVPALVQLADEYCVYLFQLVHVPFGSDLANLLSDPSIVKAGVAIRDDMRQLSNSHAFTPGGVVDLADMARQRGIQAQGLRTLAGNLLGERISKGEQCSNWSNRVLSPRQVRYAATDAWMGRRLYLHMLG